MRSFRRCSADLARLEQIAPPGVAAGARYPEHLMDRLGR